MNEAKPGSPPCAWTVIQLGGWGGGTGRPLAGALRAESPSRASYFERHALRTKIRKNASVSLSVNSPKNSPLSLKLTFPNFQD